MVLCPHLALGESALKSQSIQPDQLVWIDYKSSSSFLMDSLRSSVQELITNKEINNYEKDVHTSPRHKYGYEKRLYLLNITILQSKGRTKCG